MKTHIQNAINLLVAALAAADTNHAAAVSKLAQANLEVGQALASAGGIGTDEDPLTP